MKFKTAVAVAAVSVLLASGWFALPAAEAVTYSDAFTINIDQSQIREIPSGSGRSSRESSAVTLDTPITVTGGDILDWTFNFSGAQLAMIDDGDRNGWENFGLWLTGGYPGSLYFGPGEITVFQTGGSVVSNNPFTGAFSGGSDYSSIIGRSKSTSPTRRFHSTVSTFLSR